ncbi:MAG: NADAR family protein, partial [Firmicutes bacterium]|nr:NADAR family protein [Bacillota bacterium]
VFFWQENEENGCFSQWYQAEMVVDGVTYANCEQYMMAKKALAMGDLEYYVLIMHETDPDKIRQLGRSVRGFDSEKWAICAPKIIFDGNFAKFAQHMDLRKKLLDTGDAVLAEASPSDLIYGIGLSATDPDAEDRNKWKGNNLMGRTLMRVRAELKG